MSEAKRMLLAQVAKEALNGPPIEVEDSKDASVSFGSTSERLRRVSVNRNGTREPLVIVDRRSVPASWGRDPGGSPVVDARCEQCGLAYEVITSADGGDLDLSCSDCGGPVYAVPPEDEALVGDPTECVVCMEHGRLCDWHAGWGAGWDACTKYMASWVNGQRGVA